MSNPYPISGYVKDKDGNVIDEAVVSVVDLTLGESGIATTNSLGEYIFDLANLGEYSNGDKIKIGGEHDHTVDTSVGFYEQDITISPLFSRVPVSEYTLSKVKDLRITIDIEFENNVPMMNAGVNEIRDWLSSGSATIPTHIAWGEGTTAPAVTDTSMESEQQRNTVSITSAEREARYLAILAADEANGKALTRAGLFNAGAGGTMFVHAPHATIAKTASFDIQTQISIFID